MIPLRTVKFPETEIPGVARGWEGRLGWGVIIQQVQRFGWEDEKVLEVCSGDGCTTLRIHLKRFKVYILLHIFYHNLKTNLGRKVPRDTKDQSLKTKATQKKVTLSKEDHIHYCDKFSLQLGQKCDEVSYLALKVKVESEKVGLKLNIQKTKVMASGPITSQEIDGESVETVETLFFGAPKSLQMVTAAMKLKDAYSLEGKL